MIIEESFTVQASRDQAAAYLLDVEQVRACVPGVENVNETEPNRYEAALRMQLGPIRSLFQGSLELDSSQAPERLLASGQGRDRSSGSIAKVDFTADLEETESNVTTVRAKADVAIRGRLGQFGTGVIKRTATELVREFANCINSRIIETATITGPIAEPQDLRSPEPTSTSAPTRTDTPRAARVAIRAFAGVLFDVYRSVKHRIVTLGRRLARRGR